MSGSPVKFKRSCLKTRNHLNFFLIFCWNIKNQRSQQPTLMKLGWQHWLSLPWNSRSCLLCYKNRTLVRYLCLPQNMRKKRKSIEKESTLRNLLRLFSWSLQKRKRCWTRWLINGERNNKECKLSWMPKKVQAETTLKPKTYQKVNSRKILRKRRNQLFKTNIFLTLKMLGPKPLKKYLLFCDCRKISNRWKRDTNRHWKWRHQNQRMCW